MTWERMRREDLRTVCEALEGGPYSAYRDLRGRFALAGLDLELLRVQPDPFAGPSALRFFVPWARAGGLAAYGPDASPQSWFPELPPGARRARTPGLVDSASARLLAVRDFLGRWVGTWLARTAPSGPHGPALRLVPHGQEILDRSAVLLDAEGIEIRGAVDLPARGRRIRGRDAARLLAELPEQLLPQLERIDPAALAAHVAVVEDFAALQSQLAPGGWVGFVADGSRLARRAGNDDRPLGQGEVPFLAPPSLRCEVVLPHAGRVVGLAIPEGITLLCGGGFHGKSTLLRALAAGLVPHIPGDGRELVAVRGDAQTVRAEDGRAIHEVDLRPFLRDLPLGRSTDRVTTENASGSSSQAAAIIEALQGGSRCLLLDEDTSATNFMVRDALMEQLLPAPREPIRPFLHQARTLREDLGVSAIIVVGGSGEYFRVADHVLVLDTYRPSDETERAREIARDRDPVAANPEETARFRAAIETDRRQSRGPTSRDFRGPRVRAWAARRVQYEGTALDLGGLEALRDPVQGQFLARVLAWRGTELSKPSAGENFLTVAGFAHAVHVAWERGGFDGFGGRVSGDLGAVRVLDVLAAVDRLRSRDLVGQEVVPEREGTSGPATGRARNSERENGEG